MAGLPEVIGLLYRADWTRLSLSAELRSETDREPLLGLSREGWSRSDPAPPDPDVGGELVTRTELTDVTMIPPEAAGPARFAPPPGSHRGESRGRT